MADSISVPASTISGCSIATYVNFQAAESLRIFYLLRNGQSENVQEREAVISGREGDPPVKHALQAFCEVLQEMRADQFG